MSSNTPSPPLRGRGVSFDMQSRLLIDRFPNLIPEWDYEKNSDLDLKKVTYGSAKYAWWKCKEGHSFGSRIDTRTYVGNGCPYCKCNRATATLDVTHPELSKQWHPTKNNHLKPSNVTFGSHLKVWWLLPCGHDANSVIGNRVKAQRKFNRIDYCLICKNYILDDSNSLKARYPLIAAEWHPIKNAEITPENVTCRCRKKVWWKCTGGHEWQAFVNIRTRLRRPSGCPKCLESKGESEIEKFLLIKNVNYQKQKTFDDCRDKYPLKFDFYLPKYNVLIEFQGIQHYQPTCFYEGQNIYHDFLSQKNRDAIKRRWCNQNDYKLVCISHEDFSKIPVMIEQIVA